MQRKKPKLIVRGYRGRYLIDAVVEVIATHTSEAYASTVDLSGLMGGLMDLATWCNDVSYLKQHPTQTLIDMRVPSEIAEDTYIKMIDELIAIHNEVLTVSNAVSIIDSRINSCGFISIVLQQEVKC